MKTFAVALRSWEELYPLFDGIEFDAGRNLTEAVVMRRIRRAIPRVSQVVDVLVAGRPQPIARTRQRKPRRDPVRPSWWRASSSSLKGTR